jgi:hypothetical protein
MIEVQAPDYPIMTAVLRHSIFLAGSIEMGTAENWQERMVRELEDEDFLVIYNPRRDDWDSSWVQSIDNPQFYDQVTWELNMMEKADIIPMYFSPETKAPITLLEFGLHAASGKLIVCCPEGFWRKGNVDIVCRRNNVAQVDTLNGLIDLTKARLR